jgi:iron transport multicopper oxidase
VQLTIGSDVTIRSITAAPSVFTAGTSGLGLPRSLHAGDTLSVPVDFTPTVPGTAGGALTADTDKGSFSFGLSGTGQARGALLTATPPTISFGGTVLGEERVGTITFGNGGGQPLKIEELIAPGAPFTLEQAPQAGDEIAPGEAINVTVRYKPTAVGPADDELTVKTTGGAETIGLSGTAGLGPHLEVAPGGGWDFGEVLVGASKTVAVTLSNTGDSPMTFTKSKFPTHPAFTVLDELPEGSTLAPGDQITLRVRFEPTVPGVVTDRWTLNAGDGTAVHEVPVTGNGTQPRPEPEPESDPQPGPQPQPVQDANSSAPLDPALILQPPALTPVVPAAPVSAQDTVFPARAIPDLRVVRAVVARDGRRLTIVGLSNQLAAGPVGITVTARSTARRTATIVTGRWMLGGRFVVHLNLPPAARRWRSLTVQARFAGNRRVSPGIHTLVVVRAR